MDPSSCEFGGPTVTDVVHFTGATVIYLEDGSAIAITDTAVYDYAVYPENPRLRGRHKGFIDQLDRELRAHGAYLIPGKYGRTMKWALLEEV